jgi:eukaryotic-like serine/threonine-protein kinase
MRGSNMALQAGTRLGPYEAIALIGAGGMGEVWLARELRLGRKVALKFLPADLTRDPVRIQRFEQEARAASSLNHPNVCTIYALDQASDGQHYIAMEYVEGETLAERLGRSSLPLRDALDIAIQISSALTAAHAAGIVHRDIKPENIMIREDRLIKVLDFGLAKLVEAAPWLPDRGVTQTAISAPGSVVGTTDYMSPEQARGHDVDARTDIWAVGVVLYEMVAGRSPFAGPSGSDVLAAILQNEPPLVGRFKPDAPTELQRILTKTLRKDRSQRYQTVQDLLLDLQALGEDLQSHARVSSAPVTPITTEPSAGAGQTFPGVRPRRHRVWLAVAGAVILATTALTAWWWFMGRRPENLGHVSVVRRNLTRLTFSAGLQMQPTWSPDNHLVAYASDQAGNFDIWVQAVAGGDPVQLTRSPAQDTQPSWSPDGRTIVFRSERERGGLFVVPALGGAERQLTSLGVYPQWTPDGSEILFRAGEFEMTSLYAVSADGGDSPREILRDFLRDGEWDWIASHPDGRVSALGTHPQSGTGFFTLTRDGRRVTRSELAPGLPLLLQEGSRSGKGTRVVRFQWNSAGTALYVEAFVNEVRNVWRVVVEPTTLAWQSAEQLTAGAGADLGAALTRDGRRLVFTTERSASRLWAFPFDAAVARVTGEGTPVTGEEGSVEVSDIAPDGERVAYILRRAGSSSVDLWTVHVDSGKRELVAQGVISVCWSPDGKALAYSLFRLQSREWALAVRGLNGPERLLGPWSDESALLPSDWTRDGASILGSYFSPIAGAATVALWPSSHSAAKPERILMSEAGASLYQPRISRDGRWLALLVQRHGDRGLELVVAPAAGAPPAKWTRIAADHVAPDKPRWAPDGKALYFVSRQNASFFNLWGVRFDRERGRAAGKPFKITHFESPSHMISPESMTAIGISARRAVLTMKSATGSVWMLDNVDK